ncbi:phage tail protein [Streptomyces sp. NPDC048270]|uniref:phage tail protein n=1 Tax=Streptomyces sp. NPDC048270 TaxID=3154615 RepID=UPI00340D1308
MTQKLPGMLGTHPGQATTALPNLMGTMLDPRQARTPGDYPRAGLAMRFHVALDEWETDLGMWSSCRGLQVQFTSKEIAEGGEYFDHELLPDRLKFSAVTLERIMTQEDSPKVQAWLSQVAASWTGHEYDGGHQYTGQNVTIRLFDYQGRVVTRWVLKDALPKEWTGPELNAQSNSVATEKISFEHRGFLE